MMKTMGKRCFGFNWFQSDIPGLDGKKGKIRWGKMETDRSPQQVRGVIVLLNGRTEFMEKYHVPARCLADRGYHIFSMDWRGQGLSMRELPNHHKGFVQDFSHYVSDLDRFMQTIIVPLEMPVTIMAHSMGGHIALRYLLDLAAQEKGRLSNRGIKRPWPVAMPATPEHENGEGDFHGKRPWSDAIPATPEHENGEGYFHGKHSWPDAIPATPEYENSFCFHGKRETIENGTNKLLQACPMEKVILLSPMIDINTFPFPKKIAIALSDMAVRLGMEELYAFCNGDYNAEKVKFKNNVLTHDRDHFYVEHREIEKNPDLALGGVTWRWLKEAFDSMDLIQNRAHLAKIDLPIWIAAAGEDRVVCNHAIKRVADALPNGHLFTVKGAFHEIMFETKTIQTPFLKALPI